MTWNDWWETDEQIFYDSTYKPLQVLVVPDVNGNGQPELDVVGINSSNQIQVLFKDSATKTFVKVLSVP